MTLPLSEKQIEYLRNNAKSRTPGEWSIYFGLTMNYMYFILHKLQIKVKRAVPGTYDKSKFIVRRKPTAELTDEEKEFVDRNFSKMNCKQMADNLGRSHYCVMKYIKSGLQKQKPKLNFERPPAVYSNTKYGQYYSL